MEVSNTGEVLNVLSPKPKGSLTNEIENPPAPIEHHINNMSRHFPHPHK